MDAWEKQEGETALAYEWFCRYRDMGRTRSHAALCHAYGRKESYRSQLQVWSKRNNWVSRVEAYELHLEEQKRHEMESEQVKAAREHIQLADEVMEVLLMKLACLRESDINATQWKNLAEFAVKTKRDALGIAEKHDVSGSIDVNDKTALRISKEFLERTERLLALRGEGDGDISS
ncbi:hypothetical protein [Pleomorphochaeta sp. DL1XJH-081]|uniref:hypothetical protein n=1 Tax=Pleomorphochaeta sp. DL1XJH-081 TaxID=3409690 RepID=UPI003BB796E0